MSYIDKIFHSLWWFVTWRVVFFALVTYVSMLVFGHFGTKAKAQDTPTRWTANIKPTIGGMVFYLGFCMAMLFVFGEDFPKRSWLFMFVAGTLAFLLGLWDDIKRISASRKMSGQIFIGLIVAMSGSMTLLFDIEGGHSLFTMSLEFAAIIFIVVAIMNSVNMLDNMDGVATISTIPAMIFPLMFGCSEMFVGSVFLTAMIGFLIFNWTPSKVYMGDSGSMLLGLIVAWMVLGSDHCGEVNIPQWNGLTRIVLLLGVGSIFIVDTLVVVINRLRNGVSPATGGRDHTTHNLFYLGMKQWQIAVLFVVLGCVQIFLVEKFVSDIQLYPTMSKVLAIAPITLYFLLLFSIHYFISIRNLRAGKYSYVK